ncbi:XRE family transcriptional regulator [Micromonospora sp. WMMD712]|uniref:helix-turn-helix domain-containing protein n=1 Tax=Micromonospora sp. WMMD712 TaxID=3016096 RepID=UPI00249B1553|nr:XRE family transcriptional regulator [Micromonospora sp. WMMD712]WFE60080.1 XRE family transcriptional regulator [Micromonospora sp. WMMD712]
MAELLVADPGMLIQARESRGLRQNEVAQAMSKHLGMTVSQAYVSKAEAGRVSVSGERLEAFSTALGYPVAVLCDAPDEEGVGVGLIHHRKRASLGAPALRRIHNQLKFGRRQTAPLLAAAGDQQHRFRRHELAEDESPEEIAQLVRREWSLGDGPIPDVVAVLEGAGAVVLIRDLGTRELDAVSAWPSEGIPLFLVNVAASTDRARFSLAHELGHVIMHHVPGGTTAQEKQADMFASEFLMPARSIREQLRQGVDVNRLMQLKPRWGTSMAALARRALDVNALSDWQYRNLAVELSMLGYKTREPVSLEPESASMIFDVVQVLVRDRGATVEELAATVGLFPDEFQQLYLAPPSHGRLRGAARRGER